MKSATIPSLRVKPELRQAAESVLREGETLSGFMEESLRAGIQHRKIQKMFIARGLAAREEAQQTGEYIDAEDVFNELNGMLVQKEEERVK